MKINEHEKYYRVTGPKPGVPERFPKAKENWIYHGKWLSSLLLQFRTTTQAGAALCAIILDDQKERPPGIRVENHIVIPMEYLTELKITCIENHDDAFMVKPDKNELVIIKKVI